MVVYFKLIITFAVRGVFESSSNEEERLCSKTG